MSRYPAYAVYRIESATGTSFADEDIPQTLTLIGCVEAINGMAAVNLLAPGDPCMVLRLNTVVHHATKWAHVK